MTYDGLISYGGTEVINAQRSYAYLRNMVPTLYLGQCCPCDGVALAQGEGQYDSPSQDDAPWYSPFAAESADFYGLLPLAMDGFDDSTWSVEVTENMGDGSSSSLPRRSGRDLRFRALATAASERAMSFGLSWLRDALSQAPCGGCGGQTLCYLVDCPDSCDAVGEFEHIPFDQDFRSMTPVEVTNLITATWDSDADFATASIQPSGETWARWAPQASGVYAETVVEGLVPGATYRLAFDVGSSDADVAIEVSMPGVLTSPLERMAGYTPGFATSPDLTGAVLTFVAVECAQRIRFSSSFDLIAGHVQVSLADASQVVQSAQPGASQLESTRWVPSTTQPVVVSRYGDPGPNDQATWWFDAESGSTTYGDGAVRLTNTLTGLTPGVPYSARVSGAAWTALDGGVGTNGVFLRVASLADVTLAVSDVVAQPLREQDGGMGPFSPAGGWMTLTFVPTEPTVDISVRNAALDGPVDANDALWLAVYDVAVERLRALPSVPDPVDVLRRYFTDTVLTSGPQVTDTLASESAVMRIVEWTMRANRPDPIGEPVLVTESLGSAVRIVPEIACSLGEAVRFNLITKPSAEAGAWPPVEPWTSTNPVVPDAVAGTHVARYVAASGSSSGGLTLMTATATRPGEAWSMSLYARSNRVGARVRVSLTFHSPSVTLSAPYGEVVLDGTEDWTRITVTGVAPPLTTTVNIGLAWLSPDDGPYVAGNRLDFDAALAERTPVVQSYFDGDSRFGSWLGTPGNSVSQYERTSPALVVDPDCPLPPDPPRPPAIVNACIDFPDTWLRYVLPVPAQATARSPRSAPLLALTTASGSARTVRVRVYPDPNALGVDNLDPCAYCGEFVISYLPPNATLEVDAAAKVVTVTTTDGSQSGLNLLYGSDGGPLTWPELDCAVPYFVMIDVDADAPPLIGVSLSTTPIF